jgi:nucleoid-associated protein YgaU
LRTKKGEDFVYADESLVILPSQITDESGDENLQGSEDVASVDNSDEVTSLDTPQVDGSNVIQKQATIKLNDDASLETEEGLSTTNEATGKVSNGQKESVKDLTATNSEDKGQDISIENADEDLNNNTDTNAFQPKVVIANSDGVKVIQDEKRSDDELALDSIAYDPLGNVTVGGRSNPSGLVRFYINNEAVSATKTNEAGYWEADLSDIIPGTYTLRIDELSLKGDVISRLESPFKREDREKLANLIAPSTSPVRINIVTVQPGNTLWAIARKRYGDGLLYVQVFEANRDKIKNPDLIYPGQLFDLPDMN